MIPAARSRALVKVATYYFVHPRFIYPKPYHGLVSLQEDIALGSAWKHMGLTQQGPRWQTIIIANVQTLDWLPKFDPLLVAERHPTKLTRRQEMLWQQFCAENLGFDVQVQPPMSRWLWYQERRKKVISGG